MTYRGSAQIFKLANVVIGTLGALALPLIFYLVQDKLTGILLCALAVSVSANGFLFVLMWQARADLQSTSPQFLNCTVIGDGEERRTILLSERSRWYGLGDRVNLYYNDNMVELLLGQARVHNIQSDHKIQFKIISSEIGLQPKWDAIKNNRPEDLGRIKVRTVSGDE